MAIETRTLSGKNPKLKINLTKMFGQRIPDSFSFREGVGQAIIDEIRERTQRKRIDRNGKAFRKYSKAYSESLEFKAAGKAKGEPNLTLTGDMLGLMDIVDQGRDFITIGFPDRDDQLKAHGHILGSSPGPRVRRDFFGLPSKSYDAIAGDFTLPTTERAEEVDRGILPGLVTLAELFRG